MTILPLDGSSVGRLQLYCAAPLVYINLPAGAVGGHKVAPFVFFCNSSKTRRDSDAKFFIASNEYLAHMCTKFQTYNWSGDVTVMSQTFVTNFRKSKFKAVPKTQF